MMGFFIPSKSRFFDKNIRPFYNVDLSTIKKKPSFAAKQGFFAYKTSSFYTQKKPCLHFHKTHTF